MAVKEEIIDLTQSSIASLIPPQLAEIPATDLDSEYDPQNTNQWNFEIEMVGNVRYSTDIKDLVFLAVGSKGEKVWLSRPFIPDKMIIKYFEHQDMEERMRLYQVRTKQPISSAFSRPRIHGQHRLTAKQLKALKKQVRIQNVK